MNRFKFHNVAAGAALQDARRLRPDAETAGVVVDGDRSVKPETAEDAYTKALDRVNDSVTLGGEKKAPTEPVREDFSSEADYARAMKGWQRRQAWQANKAWAADAVKPVSKGAGWLWSVAPESRPRGADQSKDVSCRMLRRSTRVCAAT